MSLSILLVILFISYSFTAGDQPSSDHSNCSLLLTIQAKDKSSAIPTRFPLKLLAKYNSTCNISNATAYYRITPLETFVLGDNEEENANVRSMIELHSNSFNLSINHSSTLRLCMVSSNDDDHLCRKIHIGVTELHNFWNLPMKAFYICWICLLGTYHVLYWLRNKWRKSGKKSKPKTKTTVTRRLSAGETKHDTFENEKVNDEVSGDEEDNK